MITAAIVGRPNVGKSSLFNRLQTNARALVLDRPGVTRDRNYAFMGDDKNILIIDTGGFNATGPFSNLITEAIDVAVSESDIILFVLDFKDGLLSEDIAIFRYLKKKDKEIVVVVNKCDNRELASEFYSLGQDPLTVSVLHNHGIDAIRKSIAAAKNNSNNTLISNDTDMVKIAIIGLPNVGKSTLSNLLSKTDRSIISPDAGTTTNPVEVVWDLFLGTNADVLGGESTDYWRKIKLIDTGGIRRKNFISDELEKITVIHSIRSIDRADIVVYMIDFEKGVAKQDLQLIDLILEKGKSLVLTFNKVDKNIDKKFFTENFYLDYPWLNFCEIAYISARYNRSINDLRNIVKKVILQSKAVITTGKLNRCISKLVGNKQLNIKRGGGKLTPLKIKYATFIKNTPPTFLLFSNLTKDIPDSYKRYLKNGIRGEFKLLNVPVFLVFRNEKNYQLNT